MGFFSRRAGAADIPVRRPVLVLDSGRRMRAGVDLDQCLDNLCRLLPEPRQGIPKLLPADAAWLGAERPPDAFGSFFDDEGRFVVAPFWAEGDTTQFGLFPLDSGPDRLMLPLIGHYAGTFGSLSSIGTFEAGSVELGPPRLTEHLLNSTLEEAGYPVQPENLQVLADQMQTMVLLKSSEFITSQDPGYAPHFIEQHREADLGTVLTDLATWNPDVLPYVQDLLYRIRAILLERSPDGELLASIWN
ncbi:hypothetical protein ACFQH9_06555 [Pseudonocardia lutea]|uniref:SapC protein n=1 Tax=Pseudonocardia lutea TaxID=2172015 RepID=A0ABW1I2P9_9PSEU